MTKKLTHRPQVGGGEHGLMGTAAAVYDEDGLLVASVRPSCSPAEANELAKLFAFAPKLLAFVREQAAIQQSRRGTTRLPSCNCAGCSCIRLIAEYDAIPPETPPCPTT